MLEMYTAHTEEIDDIDLALSELLGPLELEEKLLSNTIGLIHCHKECLDTDVIPALIDKLDFPVVGITTISASTAQGLSSYGLIFSVLTSDDISFKVGVTESLESNPEEAFSKLIDEIVPSADDKPAFFLSFLPLSFELLAKGEHPEKHLKIIDTLTGNIPIFGSLPISTEENFAESYVLFGKDASEYSAALVAVYGNFKPQFFTVNVTPATLLPNQAVITEASGSVLSTINNVPAEDYLVSIGLAEYGKIDQLVTTPFLVEYPSGVRTVRACFGSDDDKAAILGGEVAVGGEIAFAIANAEEVVKTAKKACEKVLEFVKDHNASAALMYSCAGRNWSMGAADLLEHETVQTLLGDVVPYSFVYSGGELYPQTLENGTSVNTLQHHSVVVCVL